MRTKEPVTEGLVALLEPFIDTVVICTMTALVIVITGSYTAGAGMGGVELTSAAFASVFPWFPYVLALAVILFAFSTMISWSYYGAKCWTYLFGESRSMELLYKLIFCIFVVIGSSMSLGPVVDLSDSAIFAMAIANIIGLYILFPVVKRDLEFLLVAPAGRPADALPHQLADPRRLRTGRPEARLIAGPLAVAVERHLVLNGRAGLRAGRRPGGGVAEHAPGNQSRQP